MDIYNYLQKKYPYVEISTKEDLLYLGANTLKGFAVGTADEIARRWGGIGNLMEYSLFSSNKRGEFDMGFILEASNATHVFSFDISTEFKTYDEIINKLKLELSMLATFMAELVELSSQAAEKPIIPFVKPITWLEQGDRVVLVLGRTLATDIPSVVQGYVTLPVTSIDDVVAITLDEVLRGRDKVFSPFITYGLYLDWEYQYLTENPEFKQKFDSICEKAMEM